MSEQQPEYVWAHPEEKPKRGRVWLIVGLSVAAVIIAAVVFWLFLRPGAPLSDATPSPSTSGSPSASPSASGSPTPSATPSVTPDAPSASPEPSMTPVTTPPPPADPSIAAFRGQVEGWLDDAVTGLDIIAQSSGQDAADVVDTLRSDAQRLADATAPSSISSQWRDEVSTYADRLAKLRSAVTGGSGHSVDASSASLNALRELVGL